MACLSHLCVPGVQLPGPCVSLALGVDHSLFLQEGGAVLSCGDNSLHLLGHHPPPPHLLAPAPITARYYIIVG